MRVKNITSLRSNKPISNQFIIHYNEWLIFQSYDSIIAVTTDSKNYILLDEKYSNYSRTTSKYLYQFLAMNRKEIVEKELEGKLIYTNLNESDFFVLGDSAGKFIFDQIQELHKKVIFRKVFNNV